MLSSGISYLNSEQKIMKTKLASEWNIKDIKYPENEL